MERENAELKKMLAESLLENRALKIVNAKKILSPAHKRQAVALLVGQERYSVRRACRYFNLRPRTAQQITTDFPGMMNSSPFLPRSCRWRWHPHLMPSGRHLMNAPDIHQQQLQRMKADPGFVAALDQSGGSTPKALAAYGIEEGKWASDDEMFAIVHQMRTRIITSPCFRGDKILGAILFENTMDRDIAGQPTADYLWAVKRVVPFLKVDSGLAPERNGVQLMKPIPQLPALLVKARTKHIFGTKMRSLIKQANEAGIQEIVNQQFEVAAQILAAGLVPIIEPEVDIHCPEKSQAEQMLREALLRKLNHLSPGQLVFLKLTLPEQDDLYLDCVKHGAVARVLALSGGYSRDEADKRLRRNHGVIASFSRALLDGLTAQQSDTEFNSTLETAIESIYRASTEKIETATG